MNRISHPDWVKLCVESNYTLNQNTKIPSASYIMEEFRFIGLVGRVFANGPGDLGSIPGRIIPKTLKIVLDTSLLNTQQYKVRIKDKVE